MSTVTPEPIMNIASGFMAAKHLFTASGIGLFEALAGGPASLVEIASKTGVPARTVGIVAAAMVTLGLVERDGDRFRNTDAGAAFLAGAPGPDLRPMLRFWDQISYLNWERLEDAVRTGEGQGDMAGFTEQQQRIFSEGVEAITAGAAAALPVAYDFGPHRRVLDVGGGTGSFLVQILRSNQNLTGTLFELPGAAEVARRRLATVPEGERISIVAGDALQDPLPDGHDVVLVANTMHVLSAAHNVELLQSIRSKVSRRARLLLVDMWTDATYASPAMAALLSGEFLVISGEGQTYSVDDAEGWLGQTGWKKIDTKPLAGPGSVIVAEAV